MCHFWVNWEHSWVLMGFKACVEHVRPTNWQDCACQLGKPMPSRITWHNIIKFCPSLNGPVFAMFNNQKIPMSDCVLSFVYIDILLDFFHSLPSSLRGVSSQSDAFQLLVLDPGTFPGMKVLHERYRCCQFMSEKPIHASDHVFGSHLTIMLSEIFEQHWRHLSETFTRTEKTCNLAKTGRRLLAQSFSDASAFTQFKRVKSTANSAASLEAVEAVEL